MASLGGIGIAVITPIAFIVNVVAAFKDAQKSDAWIGLAVSGAAMVFFFGFPLLSMFFC